MTRVHRSRTDWTPEMEAELMICDNRRAFAERHGLSLATVDGRYYKLKRRSADTPPRVSNALKRLSGPRSRKAKP